MFIVKKLELCPMTCNPSWFPTRIESRDKLNIHKVHIKTSAMKPVVQYCLLQ